MSMSRKHLAFLFIYVMLICKAMDFCYRIEDFNYFVVPLLFFAGILLHMLFGRLPWPRLLRPAYLIPLLAVVFSAVTLWHKQLYNIWDAYIIQNFECINQGIYNASEIYFHQFLPFLIILLPLTAAFCLDNSRKGRAEMSVVVMSIYLFLLWYNCLDRLMGKYVVYFIFISIIYLSVCRYDKLFITFKNTDVEVSVTFRNIILYTVITAAAVTSASFAAAQIFGTKSIVQLRSDYDIRGIQLQDISKRSAFQLYSYGNGSGDSRLGGPIHLDSLIAFKVKAKQPEYLRGTVKDYYDGHSWSKSIDVYSIVSADSFVTPNRSFNLLMTGSANKKPEIKKLTIYPSDLSTSTLFSPGNAISINAKGGKAIYDSYNSYLLLGKKAINESYTIKYYRSSTGVEVFDPVKRFHDAFPYDKASGASFGDQFEACLQIPQSISPGIYKLVHNIISECSTMQDKAAAIMSYLKDNYSYSLNVSQVPDDKDFVEYFLYSEKKGYCTYFATAATIMFRIAGIPAIYVEGFNMDDEQDSDGLYIVRNYRSHAWTEILLDPEAGLWAVADCVPQGTPIEEVSSSGEYRDRFDGWYENDNSTLASDEESRYNNYGIQNYSALFKVLLYPIFILPSSLLICLAGYIIYKLVKTKRKINKFIGTNSIIPLYAHISSRLKSAGEGFPAECCELEYVKSIKNRELSVHLEKLIRACYNEHYGGIAYNGSIDIISFNRQFERYMRKGQGFIRYWYCRIKTE